MSETKGLVKRVLGFILSIAVIVGVIFGLDVKVNVNDTQDQTSEVVDDTTIAEEESVSETPKVEETETQSPVESTPTEDEEPSVDESVDVDVTEPTDDNQDVVTENTEKGEN